MARLPKDVCRNIATHVQKCLSHARTKGLRALWPNPFGRSLAIVCPWELGILDWLRHIMRGA